MLLKQIVLTSASQLHNQRSMGAIYHLLTGKRSIQTVQDAHLFGLDRFYGVYPALTREMYDDHVTSFVRQRLLNKHTKNNFSIISVTPAGKKILTEPNNAISYFNGLLYYKSDALFYKKILILTQVLTNQYKNNSTYIPVIEDPTVLQWMRQTYQQINKHLDHYVQLFHDELYLLLQNLLNEEAELFVDRLTSYKNYGLSTYQLSIKYGLSPEHVRLLLRAIVHKMLHLIQTNKVKTRWLQQLADELPQLNMLTQSAQVTYDLLNKQFSIERIASIRRLKINTIYDHIIEICWYDQHFPVDQLINNEQISLVKLAIQETKSLQLKTIKEVVPNELSYFQIRLALTRIKNVFAEGEINGAQSNKS